MRLTTFTDYCLRVLMFVGTKEDGLATIDEIAASYAISRNHLMKVVFSLGQLGYLETVRGKGGGMRLAKRPADINLGTLVRQTEQDMTLVECFQTGEGGCRLDSVCVLQRALGQALVAFMEVLDDYTLDDLLAPRRKLARTLGLATMP